MYRIGSLLPSLKGLQHDRQQQHKEDQQHLQHLLLERQLINALATASVLMKFVSVEHTITRACIFAGNLQITCELKETQSSTTVVPLNSGLAAA